MLLYEKNLSEIVTELPRLPSEVEMVCVIKYFKAENDKIDSKVFKVRKSKVLDALTWLCKNNQIYKQYVTINESKLEWMSNDEEDLPCKTFEEVLHTTKEQEQDEGPCPFQTRNPNPEQTYTEESIGSQTSQNTVEFNKQDQLINAALSKSAKSSSIPWPYTEEKAISEYDDSFNIFPKAFPWLFPGGYGDPFQFHEVKQDLAQWSKKMLQYQDGRFKKDKMWCFYTLNRVTRRMNQSLGGFFINKWYNEGEQSLEEICEDLQAGNKKWLDKITYFTQRVKGSGPYWKTKRNEVYSWINHHVQEGHGSPTFFITLSCAEFHWPDIKRLIQQQHELSNETTPLTEENYVQYVNDYTLIVQEYFQQRVKNWLDTIGKEIFKIKHYWLCYEFTPTRGQIHAHILTISDFQDIFKQVYDLNYDKEKQAEFLAKWAKESFDLTSGKANYDKPDILPMDSKFPAKQYYSDIQNHEIDDKNSMECFEYHVCSPYCLVSTKNKECKTCKRGAGQELVPGSRNTRGFMLRKTPAIVQDPRGYKRLEMERKNCRIVQTSLHMIRGWRGNCDLQILLYDSDPQAPDPAEIARVTDYIVKYTTKGIETSQVEKDNVMSYILELDKSNFEDDTVKDQAVRLARMVLNKSIKDKIISKQENNVILAGLDLYMCSETIKTVSLAGSYKLTNQTNEYNFVKQYANRNSHLDCTMDEYFHAIHNDKNTSQTKTVIPHYVGAACLPVFPVTEPYA